MVWASLLPNITNNGSLRVNPPLRARPKKHTKVSELVKKKGIPISSYDFPDRRGLEETKFKTYRDITSTLIWYYHQ